MQTAPATLPARTASGPGKVSDVVVLFLIGPGRSCSGSCSFCSHAGLAIGRSVPMLLVLLEEQFPKG